MSLQMFSKAYAVWLVFYTAKELRHYIQGFIKKGNIRVELTQFLILHKKKNVVFKPNESLGNMSF